MLLGNLAEIVLKMLVVVLAPPFEVRVLLFRAVDKSHLIDVAVYLSGSEVTFEMRVLERVVVRQGHLTDMIIVDEWFLADCLLW